MDFETLIAALGGKLGVELDGTGGACGLEVDGVDVVLQDAGDMLLVHTDLGEPPPQDPAALFRAMLEANFLYGGTGGATLAVSPADGHAHLQKYTWLERLDADGALLFVDRFAETAAHWRTLLADYRPDAPGAPSAAPAAATAPDAPGAFLPV